MSNIKLVIGDKMTNVLNTAENGMNILHFFIYEMNNTSYSNIFNK
ncbi:hypothetical protein ABID42_002048 [Arcicella rosea]